MKLSFIHIYLKQNNSLCRCFKMGKIWQSYSCTKCFRGNDCFMFVKSDYIGTAVLGDYRTVNLEWYIIVCFPEIIPQFRKQSMQCYIFHHGTASEHCISNYQLFEARNTVESFLFTWFNTQWLFLIPFIKNKMCGYWFITPEKAIEAYYMFL